MIWLRQEIREGDHMLGRVEFFNNDAGWGKIIAIETGESFFIHHRDISDPSFFPINDIEKFRTLKHGQIVMFDIEETSKPMNAAVDVIMVEAEESNSSD